MDFANNQSGIIAAQKMLKNKSYTFNKIENEALEQLRNKKLNILKPGLEIPKEPK